MLTTIILTFNEELNIAKAINSVKDISEEIFVVDSYSTDQTVEIAEKLGAKVIQNPFINQAQQFQFALDHLPIKTEWVLRLDADEAISEQASLEIIETLHNAPNDLNGIIVPFEVNFLGKKLRHGGIYPFKKMILFRKNFAYMEQRHMDEHIVLKSGKSKKLKNISYHDDFKSLSAWVDKHNKYASREILDYLENNYKKNGGTNTKSVSLKRFIKYKIYYKVPMGIRAFAYFVYRYVFRLGFLDGKPGFIFAVLQGFWYRFLVDSKIYESKILK